MRTRVVLLALLAATLVSGASSAAPGATPKLLVWFAPHPEVGPFPDRPGSKDYMQLFRRGAPWVKAARRVQVFKIYSSWLPDWLPTPQLRQIVTDLERRAIDLAVEVGTLTATDCGGGIEGFVGPDAADTVGSSVARAGGTIAYVAFDEPFAFGGLYDGPNACRWSPERVALEVADYVRRLRRYFPNVVAGDIEPLWVGVDPQVLVDWMDAYRRVTGTRLPFFHLDVDFGRPDWPQAVRYLENAARVRGIPFGVIYHGGYSRASDEEWTAAAEQRFVEYEAKEGGLRPDHVVFQSWEDLPDYVLPETKPGTFTWLIDRYFRPRTKLTLRISASTVSGKLTGRRARPLRGGSVEVSATPLDGPGMYRENILTGTVPSGAVTAVVGYRVNTECGCSGSSDFTLYEARYQEGGGPNRVPNPRFDSGLEGWGVTGEARQWLEPSDRGGQALHVSAAQGQPASTDSSPFSVTPGAPFAASFAARVAPVSTGSGYFDVVFLGAGGLEISRTGVRLAAAPFALGTPASDRRGAYDAPLGQLPSGPYLVEAWFRGSDVLFPSYASARVTRP